MLLDENALLQSQLEQSEMRRLEYQRLTDRRIQSLMRLVGNFGSLPNDPCECMSHKIFFKGQVFDAFMLLTRIIAQARSHIVLIDGFTDLGTLNVLAKKQPGVEVLLYTTKGGSKLTRRDIRKFNAQYPKLTVRETDIFHDRFLILDESIVFHVGASLKDAGKKCFAISRLDDNGLLELILQRLEDV